MVLHGSIALAGRRGEVLEDGVAWQYSVAGRRGEVLEDGVARQYSLGRKEG